jgi:hypothetical protein
MPPSRLFPYRFGRHSGLRGLTLPPAGSCRKKSTTAPSPTAALATTITHNGGWAGQHVRAKEGRLAHVGGLLAATMCHGLPLTVKTPQDAHRLSASRMLLLPDCLPRPLVCSQRVPPARCRAVELDLSLQQPMLLGQRFQLVLKALAHDPERTPRHPRPMRRIARLNRASWNPQPTSRSASLLWVQTMGR